MITIEWAAATHSDDFSDWRLTLVAKSNLRLLHHVIQTTYFLSFVSISKLCFPSSHCQKSRYSPLKFTAERRAANVCLIACGGSFADYWSSCFAAFKHRLFVNLQVRRTSLPGYYDWISLKRTNEHPFNATYSLVEPPRHGRPMVIGHCAPTADNTTVID